MRDVNEMWDFPVQEGISFVNANRIHPLMQKRVEILIQKLHKDQNIKRLVLYGSSLDFRCDSNSDIDIYIEKYDLEKKLEGFPEIDCEIDIVTNLSQESRLYKEIDATGLVLFER